MTLSLLRFPFWIAKRNMRFYEPTFNYEIGFFNVHFLHRPPLFPGIFHTDADRWSYSYDDF